MYRATSMYDSRAMSRFGGSAAPAHTRTRTEEVDLRMGDFCTFAKANVIPNLNACLLFHIESYRY